MTVSEFIAKWRHVDLSERSASQQHFLDLCDLVGHKKPAELDPTGETFTFERGATKDSGGGGWADVWKKGFFAWEYKGKHKDLRAAYIQLCQYREALENPPLLVVSDMARIQIHTNFTATPTIIHEITLDNLDDERNLEILDALFHEPEKLKPGVTSKAITEKAAAELADVAQAMRSHGLEAQAVARFLDRVVFCLFAEDIELLPDKLFTRLLDKALQHPQKFQRFSSELFGAMATGGIFGPEDIAQFNGGLFTDASTLEPTVDELARIRSAAKLDWSAVSPSIFGTLFERGMDPAKRAQIGAHYTGEEDISLLVEPVVMEPLRRDWCELRTLIDNLLRTGEKKKANVAAPDKPPLRPLQLRKAKGEAGMMIGRYLDRLGAVTVLDPACGSGNFLYVTLLKLKDLEKEVMVYAESKGLGAFLPVVGPWQLYGIEVNPYAYDLAQMSVWIGYLQWTRVNGFSIPQDPVLRPMEKNFQLKDAIVDLTDPAHPKDPEWPRVDCIVGNPPFLGGKLLRRGLGDEYLDRLFDFWEGRVPHEADLCCYWFEKARQHVADGKCKRAGLLATQGIRGGANREVLKRIKETGDIFFAISDREWILDGANVSISMVGLDNGDDKTRTLDGRSVTAINPNLTAVAADITVAKPLQQNSGLAWMGDTKGGAFDVRAATAVGFLGEPNPHGRPNSDVVVPWLNGLDVTRRHRDMWIVDFGVGMAETGAVLYGRPFDHVKEHVRTVREQNKRESYRRLWWQHVEARPAMRAALASLPRFIATTTVSKHRLFVWMQAPALPDHQLIVFARSDDYFFGVLHSRLNQVWAWAQGTILGGNTPRYTPTTCFETFPLPEVEPESLAAQRIAVAAKELCELRDRWLNPAEWTRLEVLEFPGTVGGPWTRYIVGVSPAAAEVREGPRDEGTTAAEFAAAERNVEQARQAAAARQAPLLKPGDIGTVRYPRIVPRDADCAAKLASRTLTKLYNERPTWLDLAHRQLDEAVCAAYSLPATLSDDEILEKLLELNLARADAA